MARATVFHRDPAAQAQAFEALGFEYLHVVDLDGAFAGKPVNVAAVERIIEATKIPLQLGGGIRNIATIESWLDKGITRVIIGTAAVRDPALVTKAASLYPARVAVALDARDGMVAVAGWAETSELSAFDIAKRFEDVGVAASIADVAALLQPCAKKLAGAIAGRALYDGRLDPTEALRLIRTARAAT